MRGEAMRHSCADLLAEITIFALELHTQGSKSAAEGSQISNSNQGLPCFLRAVLPLMGVLWSPEAKP